ncbi:MAG: radical SAM protein [Desulfobacterium sp.]|nr:radical SAM protein [Desulfobacterium sp.]
MKFDPLVFAEMNRRECGDAYDAMAWVTDPAAMDAALRRDRLLESIFSSQGSDKGWGFANTKPFTGNLSPGCQLCGQGLWSCLFVNNLCNANCFYCPSSQKDKSVPGTGSLDFDNPDDYVDYLNAFNIRGVSFSGGEPTLTFDRVLTFLKTLRHRQTTPFYIWMYTNGLLITEDKLKALGDEGLDEIRFDIGADRYNLDKVRMAVGTIPRVTVEIPAVPEDLERLKQVVYALGNMGVDHLNLHQLRCTSFNREKFMARNYTFLHGPGVTVLETELTALEVMKYTLDEKIPLAVNYCSFTYRHQFQGAGTRRRNALMVKKGYEDVTETGYIRSMALTGPAEAIGAMNDRLVSAGCDPGRWQVPGKGDRLLFGSSLWEHMDFNGLGLAVSYFNTALRPTLSYRHPFKEVELNPGKKVVIERRAAERDIPVASGMIPAFFDRFVNDPGIPGDPGSMAEVSAYEAFRPGLMEYF